MNVIEHENKIKSETSSGSNVFRINSEITFVETFSASLTQTERESRSIVNSASLTTIFENVINNLNIPSPNGFRVSKNSNFNDYGIRFQRSGRETREPVSQSNTITNSITTESTTTESTTETTSPARNLSN